MNERVRRQRLRLMLYNLVAFSLIFTLFGLILYGQIRTYLFAPVEETLRSAQHNLKHSPDFIERQLALQKGFSDEGKWAPPEGESGLFKDPLSIGGEFPPEGEIHPDAERSPTEGEGEKWERDFKRNPSQLSMRVQTLVRDADGELLNPQTLGRLYFDGYVDLVPVVGNSQFGQITSFTLDDSLYFSLTVSLDGPDDRLYTVQLLTNVDGEQAILKNFVRMLVVCVIVFVLLSLLASFLLSKKTMTPIIQSWNRQTEFVENASHELRTPLTIIQNKLESMLTEPRATIMQKAGEIGVSLSETRRLSKLTADLMTLARADSSETLLEKGRFSLDALVARVSEPYAELAALQNKALTLSLDCARELYADKSRIHELMVILLDNALKYTREGDRIAVRTGWRDNRYFLEVEDTGIGIPEEHRRRVFDRFYRADKARSRAAGGSGLGLSIAKWIVDEHDGAISVHAGEQGGTLMQVRLKGM